MVTPDILKRHIVSHLDGQMTLEDLAAWAEEAFRNEEFDPVHADAITEVLAAIRDAVDPHRFRWEEPDFEDLLDQVEEMK